jgi:hypothetical protein
MWNPERSEYPYPSLGWRLIEDWADLFPSPRNEREPFILTDEQATAILRWYEVHPITGKFVYRRGCSKKSKKTGKSPLEAAKCISELALDVRFDGWGADGEPVGRPWGTMGDPAPWVQIASLSEDQDENTYTPLYFFLTANDARLADELKIDAGLTRCFLMNRPDAKIEPVTSRAGSREGQPITYGCLDETGLMTVQNGGVKLAKTVRRNATGMGGRVYETTNGFMPGEGSVAEGTAKAVAKGTAGIYWDALEAPTSIDGVEVNEEASDAILRRALEVPYRGCWWTDIDRLVADIRDPDMAWSDAERFFFNWDRKGEGKAVDPKKWAELARVREPQHGEYIGLGFDGSETRDATALIACTQDGWSFPIGVWERPVTQDGQPVKDWRVPRGEVHEKVRWAFGQYRVGLMLCDPPRWETEVQAWANEFGEDRVVIHDTKVLSRQARAVDRWLIGIREGSHTHNGDETLRRHVEAAHLKTVRVNADEDDERTMYVLEKGEDHRKIDAAVADVLAYEAAKTMPEDRPLVLASPINLGQSSYWKQ